jgi:translation machinery-associated protein 16
MAPSKPGKPSSAPNAVAAKTKSAGKPKEKVFHPDSRKAGQLARKALRKGKLGNLAAKRTSKKHTLLDVYDFFFNAIPEDGSPLSLEELHFIIENVWLKRHDGDLQEEQAARRKGRPKSVKEAKLEELKLKDLEVYRTGMEVPDMTHQANIDLFRKWDQKETAYLELLRYIRISSTSPQTVVVSRKGNHKTLIDDSVIGDDAMQLDAQTAS